MAIGTMESSGWRASRKGSSTSSECSPRCAVASSVSSAQESRSDPASAASTGIDPVGISQLPCAQTAARAPRPVWFGQSTMQRFGTITREKTAPATAPE